MTRTPEQGHTPQCLAKAMIAAIENYRDELANHLVHNPENASTVEFDFRVWAQDNNAMHWADLYLSEGTTDCICPMDPIDLFRQGRPYYTRRHVEAIAAAAEAEGRPFCTECNDWHWVDEQHSDDHPEGAEDVDPAATPAGTAPDGLGASW